MALADILPVLDADDRYLALFHGIAAVADDCEGQPPRIDTEPLGADVSFDTLARWFRHWVRVRHRTGAERTLRTALVTGATPQWLAAVTLTAVTDRYFADGGHALDFLDKAFAAIDLVGWQHANALLPSVVPVLTAALGREEMDSWRHPVDLVALAERALRGVAELLRAARTLRGSWREHAVLGRAVLGDDPEAVLQALLDALQEGASPADVARSVALAAALRIAHFGTSNDHSDWDSAHHTFSYANAAFGLIMRATGDGADVEIEALCVRAAFHGALAVYLDRYLNVPPARLPLGDLRAHTPAELRRRFLDACDRQHQVAEAARIAASHLFAGHQSADFIAVLGHALLREDAGFHMVQNSSPRRDISPPILQRPGRVTRRPKSRVGSCEAVRCMRTQARLSFDACNGGLLAGRQQLPSLYREHRSSFSLNMKMSFLSGPAIFPATCAARRSPRWILSPGCARAWDTPGPTS